jgi:hypothetical protein
MNQADVALEDMDPSRRLDAVESMVRDILTNLGVTDITPDSVVTAPSMHRDPVLIRDTDQLNRFIGMFAYRARFVGYSINDLAFLTLSELCQMYLADSYPEAPGVPLSDDQYRLHRSTRPRARRQGTKDFPICFILGGGRSGTTLLRAMLNIHQGMWAPGELHLANFEGLADRATNLKPILRNMPLPELAERLREPVDSFARRFRRWELEDLAVSEVYATLHQAEPDTLIVDKTPDYSGWLDDLERIAEIFPNARFVHLIRSPHDVIQSFVRMQFHRAMRDSCEPDLDPHHIAEVLWVAHNANIEAFFRGIPADRRCTVRYEDLVASPAESLSEICGLVELPFEAAMTDPYQNRSGRVASGAGDIYVNLLDRVEERTPVDAFYPLGERCRTLAERFGYAAGS